MYCSGQFDSISFETVFNVIIQMKNIKSRGAYGEQWKELEDTIF